MSTPVLVEVTIPSIGADPLIVEINNDRYEFKAGETYEVKEDVAEVINNLIESMPSESKPASEPNLPTPTVADAGKVLSVSESGEYELGEGGGGGVVTIELTDATQTETGLTATSPMTAVEIRGLLEQGKTVIINISIAVGEEYMAFKWLPVVYSSTEDVIQAYTMFTIETSNDMISEIQYLHLTIEDDDATVTPITAVFS